MDIPIIETYRGVGIHDFQDKERIATVVKPQIDYVLSLRSPRVLFNYAADWVNPPECRLLAAARFRALYEGGVRMHGPRPGESLELLTAHVAGLQKLYCADPWRYDTFWAPGALPSGDPRPVRPPEQGERLRAAQEGLRGHH